MNVKDWQAALLGYGILMLMGETELGSLAVIFAWGIALTEILSVATSGTSPIQQLTSNFNTLPGPANATLHQNPAVPPGVSSPSLAPGVVPAG